MKIVSFLEGVRNTAGGVGIPSVIEICKSLVDEGHTCTLLIGGIAPHNAKPYLVTEADLIINSAEYKIIENQAIGKRYQISLKMIPIAWKSVRASDVVFLHSLYSFPTLIGYLFARINKKPYYIWLHGCLAPIQRKISKGKKFLYNYLIANNILNNADSVIFTAPGEKEETDDLQIISKAAIIPLGFSQSDFVNLPPREYFRNKYLESFSGNVLLYLGRLNPKKGFELLFGGVAKQLEYDHNIKLVIVGSPDPIDYKKYLEKLVTQNKLENAVVFTGPLFGWEKLAAYSTADVFIQPSFAENFGFTIFEAMAAKLPVVITNSLNYAQQIKDFNAGLVIQRDPDELKKAIQTLLSDQEARNQCIQGGLDFINQYSWQNTGKEISTLISK